MNLVNQIKELCIEQYVFVASAPQFGINQRYIVLVSAVEKKVSNIEELQKFEDYYENTIYFNPRITLIRGLTYYYEACMSAGEVIGKVARLYYIEFDYQDIDGNYHHSSAEGFEARCFLS